MFKIDIFFTIITLPIYFSLFLYYYWNLLLERLLFLVLMVVIFTVLYPGSIIYRYKSMKKNVDRSLLHKLGTKVEYSFYDDYLQIFSELEMKYSELERIYERKNLYFLFVDKKQYYVLDKDKFTYGSSIQLSKLFDSKNIKFHQLKKIKYK